MAKRKVVKTPFYWDALRRIVASVGRVYQPNTIVALIKALDKSIRMLQSNPMTGSIELLLDSMVLKYRKVVIKPYFKLIYTFSDVSVVLIDIWDTRQDPDYLVSRIGL